MADFQNKDPQFPERSGGSLLKAGIAATPLTIGVAAALKGVHTDGVLKQPIEAGIDQAMREARAKSQRVPPPRIEDMTRFMSSQKSGVNRQAWQWATSSVDPFTRKKMLWMTQNINNMSDPGAMSAIAQTVHGNDSIAMGQIWNRFKRNVDIMRDQISTGALPTFTAVNQIAQFQGPGIMHYPIAMPTKMNQALNRISSTLGGNFGAHAITRPELAAEGLGAFNITMKNTAVGDFSFQLPITRGGVFVQGQELGTRRIAQDTVMIGEGGKLTRMSRQALFLRELEEGIVPGVGGRLRNQSDVKRAVKRLGQKVFGELESSPFTTLEDRTAAAAQREAMRGSNVQMLVPLSERAGGADYRPGFRIASEDEITAAMMSPEGRAMGLTGGVGPKGMSQGVRSTIDFDRFSVGAPDYSRRPEQPFRQFQITEASMQRLNQHSRYGKYRAMEMAGQNIAYENVARPHLRATYVNPEMHMKALQDAAMGEGETLLLDSTMRKIEYEENITQKIINPRTDIANLVATPGEVLGQTPLGDPYQLPSNTRMTGVHRVDENTLAVQMIKTHRLRHGDKLFDATKAVALRRGQEEFDAIISGLGGGVGSEIIINMDELKKNRQLHRRQMVTSMMSMLESRQAAPSTRAQARFMSDPFKLGSSWARSGHEAFTRKAMRFATKQLGATPAEFGEIFGAVPYVFGEEGPGGAVSRMIAASAPRRMRGQFEASLGRGIAGGMAELAFGGPMLDVGGMGSLEPRAFDILKASPMGKAGEEISTEFMSRLAATNPQKVIAHAELQKTLASLAGGTVAGGGAVFGGGSFRKFLEAGGGVVPTKLGDVYVPGMDVMSELRPFETHTGVTTQGKISDIYEDIARASGLADEGAITQEELRSQLSRSAEALRREYAPAGKGVGGVARGKMAGSMFLRGVSAQGAGSETAIRQANVVGITKNNFERMISDMKRTGLYAEGEMEQMAMKFRKGQRVAGMLGRHPFLGQFSLQPVMMEMAEGRDDLIVLPEIVENVKVRAGAKGAWETKSLTLGPLAGLSGDKDADAYSLMLVSPRNEEMLRKSMFKADSDFTNQYAQHQVRMQLFKAGKAKQGAETLPLKQMLADVEKLSVGQKWIAPLSLEMTSAKRALTKFGSGAAAADARFLLEWFEQTPISAKHMTAEQAAGGGLQSLMMSVTDSMQERNAKRLEGVAATIVKDNAVAARLISQSVSLDPESAAAISRAVGAQVPTEIAPVNVPRATKEIMRVLSEADRTGYSRAGELLSGRGAKAKMREIAELGARSAFLGMADEPGVMNKVAKAFTTANNTLGSIGAGIIRNHKAIGFGFAGTLALGAALSSPPDSVGPGRAKIPDARLNMNRTKGANRMKPENVHPAGKDVGAPQAPQMLRGQDVRVSTNQGPRGARVVANLPANANVQAVAAGMTGFNRNTNVNLRDNRQKLHADEIANKLL